MLAQSKHKNAFFIVLWGLLLSVCFINADTTVKMDDANGPTRNSLNNAFAKIFKNQNNFGQCSKIAISYHPSMQSWSMPFSVFAADYNNGFTMKPKKSNPDGSFVAVPTEGKFDVISDLDYEIDDFGGDILEKFAVSTQGSAISVMNTTNASTAIFDAAGKPLVDTATLKGIFSSSGSVLRYSGNNANDLTWQGSLLSKLAGVAVSNRVFVKASKYLMPISSDKIFSPLDKTNWKDLVVNNVAIPSTWTDFAPIGDNDSFLQGKPLICKGELLVVDDLYKQCRIQPVFRVDVAANTTKYDSNMAALSTSLLRYIILNQGKPSLVASAVFEQAFKAGQMASQATFNAFSGLLTVKSVSPHSFGLVALTNQGVFNILANSLADFQNVKSIPPPAQRLDLPNFNQYVRIKVASSAGILYVVAIRSDTTFDVAKVDTKGNVQTIRVPGFVDSVSVDSVGHLAVVDSQIHELWWANVADVLNGASAFSPDAMKGFVAQKDAELAKLEQLSGSAKSDIAKLKDQENAVRQMLKLADVDYYSYVDYLSSILGVLSNTFSSTLYQTFIVLKEYAARGISIDQTLLDRKAFFDDATALLGRYSSDVVSYDTALKTNVQKELIDSLAVAASASSTILNIDPADLSAKLGSIKKRTEVLFNAKMEALGGIKSFTSEVAKVNQQLSEQLDIISGVKGSTDASVVSIKSHRDMIATALTSRMSGLDATWDAAMVAPISVDSLIAAVKNEITALTTKIASLKSADGTVSDVQVMCLNQQQSLYEKLLLLYDLQGDIIDMLNVFFTDEWSAKKAAALLIVDSQAQVEAQARISALYQKVQATAQAYQDNVAARNSVVSAMSALAATLTGQLSVLSTNLKTQKAALDKLQADVATAKTKLSSVVDVSDPNFAALRDVMSKSDASAADIMNAMTDTIQKQKALIVALQSEKEKATAELTTLVKAVGGSLDTSKSLFDQIKQYADLITANALNDKNVLSKQLEDQQKLAATLSAQANSIQSILDTAVTSGNLTGLDPKAGLLDKLKFVLQAKDDLITKLNQQLGQQAQQLADNQKTIDTLKKTEDVVRSQVQAALAKAGSTDTAVSSSTVKLEDLMPILLSVVDAKEALIKKLQLDLAAKDKALQESLASRQSDATAAGKVLESLDAYAKQQTAGSTVTLQFSAGATLQDKIDQLMQFKQAQMMQMTAQYQNEKADMLASLADLQLSLNKEQQKTASLTDLTETQKVTIKGMQDQLEALAKKLADKDVQLQSTKTEMNALTQRLQQQVDDLKKNNEGLLAQINQKDLLINDQKVALAEKDKLIQEKTNLSAQYANGLAIEQQKTAKLTDDLNKQTALLAAAQKIISDKQAELDAANIKINELVSEKAALAEMIKNLQEQYNKRIADLEAMNAAQKKRIADLEDTQKKLLDTVDVLSGIIDNHVSPTDLSEEERARLSNVIGQMGTEASLVQAMLNGPIDLTQLEPYCCLLIGQDLRKALALYGDSKGLADDVVTRLTELSKVHDMLYKLVGSGNPASFKAAYESLDASLKALVVKYLPNIDVLLQSEQIFKAEMSKAMFGLFKNQALIGSIQNWDTSVGLLDAAQKKVADECKAEILKVLQSPPDTLKTVVVKFRLNAVFEQKQAELKVQKEVSDAQLQKLQDNVDASKKALEEAIKNGQANLDAAVKQYTDNLNAKDAKIKEQADLMNKLGDIFSSSMSASSDLEMSLMKRMAASSGQELQTKLIQSYQDKMSKLNAAIIAQRGVITNLSTNQSDPQTANKMTAAVALLQKMTAAYGLMSRNLELSPYIVPLAIKMTPDGNVVKYSKEIDVSGSEVEVGKEELGTQELISLCQIDPKAGVDEAGVVRYGVARYLDNTSVTPDGQIFMLPGNRFSPKTKLFAVNRGNNLVSFELLIGDKRFIITLVKNSRIPMLPNNMTEQEKATLAPYMSQILNYDVRALPYNEGSPVTDDQLFYVEGVDSPVYPEAVILRTHSSADNFKQDMKGFLSVDSVTTPGKSQLVYMPYISDDYHSKPGNKETIFSIARFEALDSDEKAAIDLMKKLGSLDSSVVVDSLKGFTAYDQALEVSLNSFLDKTSKVMSDRYRFEDAALKLSEMVEWRNMQGSLTAMDLKQYKDAAKKLSAMIFGQGANSNLALNSAGYKALIGQVDRDGKVIVPGLLNTADLSARLSLDTNDYLSLSDNDSFLTFLSSSVAAEQPAVMANGNLFNKNMNLKVIRDSATGLFKIMTTSAVPAKLAIVNGAPIFVPESVTASLDDQFTLSGSMDKLAVSNSKGFLKVSKGVDGKPVLSFATYADPAKPVADFGFVARSFKPNSFGAKLLDLAGQAKNPATNEDFGQMVLAELKRDMTKVDQTLADAAAYLAMSVNDQTRQVFMPYVQNLISSAMSDVALQKFIKPELLDVLEASLSLFDLKDATYFIIKDKDGSILRMGSPYISDEMITVEGKTSNKIYNDFEFVDSQDLMKSALFRIVPKPGSYGSYLIMSYQYETGTSLYVATVPNLSLKSKDANLNKTIKASVVTGSSAESYKKDKQVSTYPAEFFEVSGTMASIKIRSMNPSLGVSSQSGYLVSLKDDSGIKKLVAVDPVTGSGYSATDNTGQALSSAVFNIQALSDGEAVMMLTDVELLPVTFYALLLNISKNLDKDMTDEKRTAMADALISGFKKMVCTIDGNGKMMVKDYYFNRNLTTVVTDANKGVYSMVDVLSFIQKDLIYEARRGFGIKFSKNSQDILKALEEVFNPMSLLDQVLNPNGIDIAVYLHTNQEDLAKIKPVWQKLVSFVYGRDVSFVDDKSLTIANFEAIIPRQDLSANAKDILINKLQGMLATGVITKNDLPSMIGKLLQKLRPEFMMSAAIAKEYKDMLLYDRLDLAENMLSGRYRDPKTGTLVMGKNFTEASKILEMITDDEINREADAMSYKQWHQSLQKMIGDEQFALTPENIAKVLKPGGVDLAKFMLDNQQDVAKIKPVWSSLLNLVAGKITEFETSAGLVVKTFDRSFAIRTDMTDAIRQQMVQALQKTVDSLTNLEVKLVVNKLLLKLRGWKGFFSGLNVFDMSAMPSDQPAEQAPAFEVSPVVSGAGTE